MSDVCDICEGKHVYFDREKEYFEVCAKCGPRGPDMSNPSSVESESLPEDIVDPVERALAYAVRYGQIDGEHHKLWVIDQMVRALTNCPIVDTVNVDTVNESAVGGPLAVRVQGESAEYRKLVAADEDEQLWNVGIAP